MNKLFTLFLIFVLTNLIYAQAFTVYKKVNKDGTITYSDKPFPGSVKAKLPPINTQDPQRIQPPNLPEVVNTPPKQIISIDILSPTNGDSVRSNEGKLTIMVQKQQPAGKKYLTQLIINGEDYKKPIKGTVFKVKNLDRGIIKLKAKLLTRSGKILATSSETVVYMHKTSIIQAK